MYRYHDEVDYKVFYRFPRSLVTNGIWGSLPPAAQAVLPVYGCCMNTKTGMSFPDELTLSSLAGVTPKVARAGRHAIMDIMPGVTGEMYVTSRGRRAWRLHFSKQADNQRGSWKAFFGCILHCGNWAHLRIEDGSGPTAQALYVAMLAYSFASDETLPEDHNEPVSSESFGNHPFEFCHAERAVLLKSAGITRRSFETALHSLVSNHLLARDAETGDWKIFRHPPKRFKPEYMNAILSERGL